ncbi:hypothetical protein [Caballeronia sordidicola]|uniref:hypothetical protein n=1 Tax=Caballeronia sordidicola TaxID=196367 RepID=UPI001363E890|nr:hypothetical protein [Caballeronia sordidicola]
MPDGEQHQHGRGRKVDHQQQESDLAKRRTQYRRKAPGERRNLFVDLKNFFLRIYESRISSRPVRKPAVKPNGDLLQLVHVDVATLPEVHCILEVADMAKDAIHPCGAHHVRPGKAAHDQFVLRQVHIGLRTVKNVTSQPQVPETLHRLDVPLVQHFVAVFCIQVQEKRRVFLAL